MGAPDLRHPPVLQHDDAVGHGHGLDLVVGDVDGGRLQLLVQRADLRAHLHAQLGIEVGERLVEQEELGIAHDGAAHGDALTLAARELAGIALEQLAEAEDVGRPLHPLGDQCAVRLPQLQAEGHVVVDGLVRVERVVLEHHGDVAVARRHVVHDAPSPMLIWPALISSRPAIIRSSVDLPQPDGPTSTTNSPSPMSMSTP